MASTSGASGDASSEAAALLGKHADLLRTHSGTLCRVRASGREALIDALIGKASDHVLSQILEREGVIIAEGSLQRHRTRVCRCHR